MFRIPEEVHVLVGDVEIESGLRYVEMRPTQGREI
jgi:hypothetical protein